MQPWNHKTRISLFDQLEKKVLQMEFALAYQEMLMCFKEASIVNARWQAMAALIGWKEELATWKFQLLYRLILDQQEELNLWVYRVIVDSLIQTITAHKRNQFQYYQVQKLAISYQEHAKLALEKGYENWAYECLLRKNSVIKIASQLKATLDEQKPLIEMLTSKLHELESKIGDEPIHELDELKHQRDKLIDKIAKFDRLYCSFCDSLSKKEPH